MDQSTGSATPKKPPDLFCKDVQLLKKGDFRRIDNHVYIPTERIRINAQLGQFRKGVEFTESMSVDAVKKKLQEVFPCLENTR